MKKTQQSTTEIISAVFVKSSTEIATCPETTLSEYAFIGRSNVGKSSLINMLTQRKKLAKTSSTPGKTQLINHFLLNGNFYFVDLPGYGWAKKSKKDKQEWEKMNRNYLTQRTNLECLFVLLDIRHPPQKIDLTFLSWCIKQEIPISLIFTKADKLKAQEKEKNLDIYQKELLKLWEFLPPLFITSSESSVGKSEVTNYILQLNKESSDLLKK